MERDTMIPHEAEFELYHYGESLCSQMVRLVLEEKQIAYKSHHMHLELTGENLSRAYKKINPKVVVPVWCMRAHRFIIAGKFCAIWMIMRRPKAPRFCRKRPRGWRRWTT